MRKYLALSAIVWISAAAWAEGGITRDEQLSQESEGAIIAKTNYPVVLGIIEKVSSPPATNGSPPQVRLQIEQTLRGPIKRGPLTGIWGPTYFPDMYDTGEARTEWANQPLQGPAVGKKMILVGHLDTDGRFHIHPYGRFDYSEAKLKWAKKNIQNIPK